MVSLNGKLVGCGEEAKISSRGLALDSGLRASSLSLSRVFQLSGVDQTRHCHTNRKCAFISLFLCAISVFVDQRRNEAL